MCEEAEARGHLVMAMRLLEQAAKGCGVMFTVGITSNTSSEAQRAARIGLYFALAPGVPYFAKRTDVTVVVKTTA